MREREREREREKMCLEIGLGLNSIMINILAPKARTPRFKSRSRLYFEYK